MLQASRASGEDQRDPLAFAVGYIHAFIFHDVVAKQGQGSAVHREFTQLHRLLVRRPIRLVFGDTFEGAAGVGDFDIVILQQNFRDGHRSKIPFVGVLCFA